MVPKGGGITWGFAGNSDFPAPFALQVRWLRSLTPVTEFTLLPGMSELAAFLQHKWLWEIPSLCALCAAGLLTGFLIKD
ncbi:hypothetical protein DEU53_112114 [Pantoea sp. AG1095]|nr:hypothetical protein DEU53_112114 [Pantoea sp. AG1095]